MLTLAQSLLPGSTEALEADDDLFNCANGTIDLRTGALRPHDRADLLTRRSPVASDPAVACPLWDASLDRVLGGSAAAGGRVTTAFANRGPARPRPAAGRRRRDAGLQAAPRASMPTNTLEGLPTDFRGLACLYSRGTRQLPGAAPHARVQGRR
jgi:hypothetical protein